jgi:hypothetical protein
MSPLWMSIVLEVGEYKRRVPGTVLEGGLPYGLELGIDGSDLPVTIPQI